MRQVNTRIIRGWALIDLAIGLLMAVPPVAQGFLSFLYSLSNLFGAKHDIADFPALGMMLMSMAGALIIVWALARLLRPDRLLATIDSLARIWVGGLIGWFVLFQGVPVVILAFVVGEWAGAVHQGVMLTRRRVSPAGPGNL